MDTAKHPKTDSYAKVKEIKDRLKAELPEDDDEAKTKLSHYFETLRERIFREQVTRHRRRPDARAFDEILRPVDAHARVRGRQALLDRLHHRHPVLRGQPGERRWQGPPAPQDPRWAVTSG